VIANKKNFREASLHKLRQINPLQAYAKDKKIMAELHRIIKEENARSIMLYLPLSSEVNLSSLITKLRKEKRILYVPFMEGKSFRLVKYRLPLNKKKFGIKEPNNSKQYRKRNIALAIVPIVGVDITLRRIGFGKGMYDRFFEKEKQHIGKVLFVARTLCYSDSLMTHHHDVWGDMLITS